MDAQLNWDQLLKRIGDNASLLDQLEEITARHDLTFTSFFSVLIESGFTIPEAQELYQLLDV